VKKYGRAGQAPDDNITNSLRKLTGNIKSCCPYKQTYTSIYMIKDFIKSM